MITQWTTKQYIKEFALNAWMPRINPAKMDAKTSISGFPLCKITKGII
jgi:hypothetical protein